MSHKLIDILFAPPDRGFEAELFALIDKYEKRLGEVERERDEALSSSEVARFMQAEAEVDLALETEKVAREKERFEDSVAASRAELQRMYSSRQSLQAVVDSQAKRLHEFEHVLFPQMCNDFRAVKQENVELKAALDERSKGVVPVPKAKLSKTTSVSTSMIAHVKEKKPSQTQALKRQASTTITTHFVSKARKAFSAAQKKLCLDLLSKLASAKYQDIAYPFLEPVDPVALSIPTYFNIIKQPMDLSTVRNRLTTGQHGSIEEFRKDIELIFSNCFTFNKPGQFVYNCGQKLQALFEKEWRCVFNQK